MTFIELLQDFSAKLSDFGLARDGPVGDKSHVSTRVVGTRGYAAPEYVATGSYLYRFLPQLMLSFHLATLLFHTACSFVCIIFYLCVCHSCVYNFLWTLSLSYVHPMMFSRQLTFSSTRHDLFKHLMN